MNKLKSKSTKKLFEFMFILCKTN